MKCTRWITLLSLLIFAAGCGEGFRSQGLSSGLQPQTQESEYFDDQGNRRSFTEVDVDLEILRSYANELQGREQATQALTASIRAFDLTLAADQNQRFQMRARIVLSCNESYTIQSSVSQAQMQTMQPVVLGQDGPFQVQLRCSTSGCQEMVAVIRRLSGGNQGTVLTGLGVGGQSEGTVVFVSRTVGYVPYFASFLSVPAFEQQNQCSTNQTDEPQTIGDILTDQAVEIGLDLLEGFLEDTDVGDLLEGLF